VTRRLELDLLRTNTTVFGGGYESYLEERAVARRHRREEYDEFAERRPDLVARARTQRNGRARVSATRYARLPTMTRFGVGGRRVQREAGAEGASDGEPDRPPRGGRRTPQEWTLEFTIELPHGRVRLSRHSTMLLCDRVIRPRSSVPANQCRRADRDTGPKGQASRRCCGCFLGRRQPDDGPRQYGRPMSPPPRPPVGEIDQARPISPVRGDWSIVSSSVCRPGRPPCSELCSQSSGCGQTHVERSVDELSPGERTRAGLALLQACGRMCWFSTSRRITSNLAAIEQLEQALETTTVRCYW